MNNIKDSFKTRSFRSGGYTVLMSFIVIAIVVAINLLVSGLPEKYKSPEIGSVKLYDFTEQTREIAESVDEDITIYVWKAKADADSQLSEFLTRYSDLNSRITVKYIDPALNPNFITTYSEDDVTENSLIVVSGKRSKIVDFNSIYTYSYSQDELYYYYYTYGSLPSADLFDAENTVSNAVDYVTTDILPKVYALTGHGETTMGSTLLSKVASENIDLADLSLASAGTVPTDCDALLIVAPQYDISDEEFAAVKAYAEGGGAIILFTDYSNCTLTNIAALCEYFGMRANCGVVLEQSSHYVKVPYYLLAEKESHDITDPLIDSSSYIIFPVAHGIEKLSAFRNTLTITTLLSTTSGAYLKQEADLNTTTDKAETDPSGPFILAAAATETVGDNESKFVWFSSSSILTDSMQAYGNTDLILNTFGWVTNRTQSISIRSVSMASEALVITDGQANFWFIFLTIIIPLFILAGGFAVWYRRRKR